MVKQKIIPILDKVIDLYVSPSYSTLMISRELGISKSGITQHLKKLGLVRSPSEATNLAYKEGRQPVGLGGKKRQKYVRPDSEEVKRLYIDMSWSALMIGKHFGVSDGVIGQILRDLGLLRSLSEASRLAIKQGRNAGRYIARDPRIFKGGRHVSGGYISILSPDHPRAKISKYVAEHILVWEAANNQLLPLGWHIHHLNGIKDDNRPENLVAMKAGEHVHQAAPFKKRIRELEEELKRAEDELSRL